MDVDQTIIFRGKTIILKQLVITPIDQWITTENPDGIEQEDLWQILLSGCDQDGDPVEFFPGFYTGFQGSRDNKDATTYQLDRNVESYTLRA